jgi:hypothetical protein
MLSNQRRCMGKYLHRGDCAAAFLLASVAASQAASYSFDFSNASSMPPSSYAGMWNVAASALSAGFTDIIGLLNGSYDVYLYAPSNSVAALGNGNVNGTTFDSITGGTTLDEGVSYRSFAAVNVSGGLLNAAATSIGIGASYAGLAGMQLVGATTPVPLPAGALLLLTAFGAAGITGHRRKS